MKFSVIVPTRDRPGALERCLESLAELDYKKELYEVVVVDDGGSALLTDVINRISTRVDASLVSTGHRGPAAARNAGIERSRFEYLAFIDDDCTAHPSWLTVVARELSGTTRSLVGGRVVNGIESNPYSRASQGLQDFLYRWYHEDRRGDLPFFTTNNLAVARQDFDSIGAFDVTFPFASEDRDWCDRAAFAGRELRYAQDAIVYHWHELSFSQFLQQHFRYGRGAVRFHSRRAARRGHRIKLEHVDFYRGMFAAPFVMRRVAPISETLLLLASQSASFAGFVAELATPENSQRINTLAGQR